MYYCNTTVLEDQALLPIISVAVMESQLFQDPLTLLVRPEYHPAIRGKFMIRETLLGLRDLARMNPQSLAQERGGVSGMTLRTRAIVPVALFAASRARRLIIAPGDWSEVLKGV
jgi:hypothetical protein